MTERIQRKRTKGWRMPDGAVYVGRPGRWGNPFAFAFLNLAEQIDLYRDAVSGIWNPSKIQNLSDADAHLVYRASCLWKVKLGTGHPTEIAASELKGRDLACWCPLDEPCHADVLLKVANRG